MKLYEINAKIAQLLATVEAAGGELTNDMQMMLNDLEVAQSEKIASIVGIIKQEEERRAAIKREKERLSALDTHSEKKIDWLESYLTSCIGAGNNYDGQTFKIGWRKSTETVVDDEALLPKLYIKEVVTYKPDKELIKADLKNGATIEGARLLEKQNIQIK